MVSLNYRSGFRYLTIVVAPLVVILFVFLSTRLTSSQARTCLDAPPPRVGSDRPIGDGRLSLMWASDAGSNADNAWCFEHRVFDLSSPVYVRWDLVGLDDTVDLAGWVLAYTANTTGVRPVSGALTYGLIPSSPVPTTAYLPQLTASSATTPEATGEARIATILKDGSPYIANVTILSRAHKESGGWLYFMMLRGTDSGTPFPGKGGLVWITSAESIEAANQIALRKTGYPSTPIDLRDGLEIKFLSQAPPISTFASLRLVKPDGSSGSIGLVPVIVPSP